MELGAPFRDMSSDLEFYGVDDRLRHGATCLLCLEHHESFRYKRNVNVCICIIFIVFFFHVQVLPISIESFNANEQLVLSSGGG